MKIRQVAPDISGIRDDHVARYRFAVDKMFGMNLQGRILDVGCGVGYGTHLMATQCGMQAIGIDIDSDTIDYARAHYQPGDTQTFLLADLAIIDDLSSFQAITMFEIIEHSALAPAFLVRAAQEVKYLFGSVPNEEVVPFSRGGYNSEHYRHYTPDEILEELEDAGWLVTVMGSQKGKKGPAAKINTLNRHGRTIVFMAESMHV